MMFIVGFCAVVFLNGLLIMIAGARNAPEGIQDETGFRFVWRNDAPETPNVVCIWKTLSEHSVTGEDDTDGQWVAA